MRFALACLALLLFTADADAQRRGHSIAREGDLALTVGFVGLDNLALRPLDGGIGLRYRVSDLSVVGASVGLSFSDDESESSGSGREDVTESNFFGTSLSLWTERHLAGSRVVSPFIGLGGRVGISRSDAESTSFQTCDPMTTCPPTTRRSESERLAASGGVLLGAEVKLVRGVTLGGAYTLGVEYSQSESTTTTTFAGTVTPNRVDDRSGWRYGVGTTQLNLSVYF